MDFREGSPLGVFDTGCPTLSQAREQQLLPESVLNYLDKPENSGALRVSWERALLDNNDPRRLTVASLLDDFQDALQDKETFEEVLVVMSIITILNLDRRVSFDLMQTDTRIRLFSFLFVTDLDVKETTYMFPLLMNRYYHAVVENQDNPTSFRFRESFVKSYLNIRKKHPTCSTVDPFTAWKYGIREKRLYLEMENDAKTYMEQINEQQAVGASEAVKKLKEYLNESHRLLIEYMRVKNHVDEEVVPRQIHDDDRDFEQPELKANARVNALTILKEVQDKEVDFDTDAMMVDESEQDGTNQMVDDVVGDLGTLGLTEEESATRLISMVVEQRL